MTHSPDAGVATNDAGMLARRGLILLDANDNCFVVTRDLQPGDVVEVGDERWVVSVPLTPGHKVARWPIETGVVVTKFGVPIGVAARPIATFEHIHLHNLASQYIPTHERGESVPTGHHGTE